MSKETGRPSNIDVIQDSFDEGQDAVEIRTPGVHYFYQFEGGGFSSLIDRDGHDWIGYAPGNGPAGEYRGIPNMVFRRNSLHNNHFHPGHAGVKGCTTKVIESEPSKAILESSVEDRWRVRWEITERLARLSVLDADPGDHGYWFLYEGTPGGRFNKRDRCLRSDGKDEPLSRKWESTTSSVNWVAFRVPSLGRSLLFNWESDLVVPVSYYPMKSMTVFGFGRRLNSTHNLIAGIPVQVTVRLLETADSDDLHDIAR